MQNALKIQADSEASRRTALPIKRGFTSKRETEQLIKKFQPLVRSAVSTYGKYLSYCQNEDLESVANLGLLEAIHSYNPAKAKSQRFAGWAKMYVLNAVRSYIYKNTNLIKGSSYSGAVKMFWLLPRILDDLKCSDTDIQLIAKKYGVSVDNVIDSLELLKSNVEYQDVHETNRSELGMTDLLASIEKAALSMSPEVCRLVECAASNPDSSHQEIGSLIGRSSEWVRIKLKEVRSLIEIH